MVAERRIAWVFPGQGIQEIGIGAQLFKEFLLARRMLSAVDRISRRPISTLSFEGPAEEQNRTLNTQLIVFSNSQICYEIVSDRRSYRSPVSYFAGNSLGEYNALAASGACGFEDTTKMVRERSKGMQLAQELNPGGMAATKNISEEAAWEFKKMGLHISLVNTHEQTILGGTFTAMDRSEEWAKRYQVPFTRLKVGGAFHTPLMEPAVEVLVKAFDTVEIKDSEVPIIANTTAKPIQKAAEIKEELIRQLTNPVLFRDTISFLDQQNLDMIIEASQKAVVMGMVKKMIVGGTITGITVAGGIKVGSCWKRHHLR